jgi:hypothetical protein
MRVSLEKEVHSQECEDFGNSLLMGKIAVRHGNEPSSSGSLLAHFHYTKIAISAWNEDTYC